MVCLALIVLFRWLSCTRLFVSEDETSMLYHLSSEESFTSFLSDCLILNMFRGNTKQKPATVCLSTVACFVRCACFSFTLLFTIHLFCFDGCSLAVYRKMLPPTPFLTCRRCRPSSRPVLLESVVGSAFPKRTTRTTPWWCAACKPPIVRPRKARWTP